MLHFPRFSSELIFSDFPCCFEFLPFLLRQFSEFGLTRLSSSNRRNAVSPHDSQSPLSSIRASQHRDYSLHEQILHESSDKDLGFNDEEPSEIALPRYQTEHLAREV
jgi:hypothetical protein